MRKKSKNVNGDGRWGEKAELLRERMGLSTDMLSAFTNGLDGAPHRVVTNSTNIYLVPVN